MILLFDWFDWNSYTSDQVKTTKSTSAFQENCFCPSHNTAYISLHKISLASFYQPLPDMAWAAKECGKSPGTLQVNNAGERVFISEVTGNTLW